MREEGPSGSLMEGWFNLPSPLSSFSEMGYNEGVSWILPTLECSAPAETGERWPKDGLAEFRVA